ncbi:MAG: type II toxin-antitoxin system VapC family toxin [Methylococcales bacterium]
MSGSRIRPTRAAKTSGVVGRFASGGTRPWFHPTRAGVWRFFARVMAEEVSVFLSVVTIGELRRGIELIRLRGDRPQSRQLEGWLQTVLADYGNYILPIDPDIAQLWGRLRVPHSENALDKQIAATALIHDLTLVTRNQRDFQSTGARLLDVFED